MSSSLTPTSPRASPLERPKRGSSSGTRSVIPSSLPPPPVVTTGKQRQHSNYAQNIAKSMTIDEMRQLHQRALSEAEAKQTELRLVLASRYRELVGSSDEVTKMRERAQELHELVHALPNMMSKVIESSISSITDDEEKAQESHEGSSSTPESKPSDSSKQALLLRRELALLPRVIHRSLDSDDVHNATTSLIRLFRIIAEQTDEYPLATALAPELSRVPSKELSGLLRAQMRMIFLHVETLPARISRISVNILRASASYGAESWDPTFGAQTSAAALSSLDLLEINQQRDRIVQLLDLYFNSKARLLTSLLSRLYSSGPSVSNSSRDEPSADGGAHNAESILSKIVLILQYDIIVHPYEIFILRKFPCCNKSVSSADIMKSLPMFPAEVVQSKASTFLAAHLPLIRTKVKSVLVDIAGTTASALGKIRQSLYDKTDGVECIERLDKKNACTWEEAVNGIVDVQTVLSSHHGAGVGSLAFPDSTSPVRGNGAGSTSVESQRRFSLWGVLFSNTFSSLVHSLLTTSFHSVHAKVVSSLRLSLANAPPLSALLPHEAYRNTLHIASELDAALLKVSDDAHELLVHAEERAESERRLRQSLYVQTCEIMGRLICELRRMLTLPSQLEETSDKTHYGVKELIVGRLCHLLKFRLTGLPTLLDPNSSPAKLHGSTGMISLVELSSSFDLADDNDDGLITFDEAMQAAATAFSGTQFHGAEMVRETLLLSSGGDGDISANPGAASTLLHGSAPLGSKVGTSRDVTLNELVLLSARGLRHESSGRHSALGTIQNSLDDIIDTCFDQWAKVGLTPSVNTLSRKVDEFVKIASTASVEEYQRMYSSEKTAQALSSPTVENVSPCFVAYLLETSTLLNRSICPSDSLLPVPTMEYAVSMGIGDEIPSMMDVIRGAVLRHALASLTLILQVSVLPALDEGKSSSLGDSCPSGLYQLKNDLSFVNACFFDRNTYGFGSREAWEDLKLSAESNLNQLMIKTNGLLGSNASASMLSELEGKRNYAYEVCSLFLSPLLGEDTPVATPSLSDFESMQVSTSGSGGARAGSTPLLHMPLPSTCRFSLLPIQSDRTLSDVQLRGKYNQSKVENERRQETNSGGVMSSGLGFFSSILKTN